MIKIDLSYMIKKGEYSQKISCYKTHVKLWNNNKTEGFTLVLQNYLEELQAQLKN